MERPNSFEREKDFSVDVITTKEQFSDIRNSLIQLDKEAFEGKSAIAGHWYHAQFNPEDILIILRKSAEEAIGYLLAHPTTSGLGRTAHVYSTVIAPEYRGKGLSDHLENGLEMELRKRGYEYITRDSVKKNGYADHLTKRYGDRIVHSMDYSAALGPAREMTIKL